MRTTCLSGLLHVSLCCQREQNPLSLTGERKGVGGEERRGRGRGRKERKGRREGKQEQKCGGRGSARRGTHTHTHTHSEKEGGKYVYTQFDNCTHEQVYVCIYVPFLSYQCQQ